MEEKDRLFDEHYHEDPAGFFKGATLGILLGTLMWAVIVGCVWMWLR